MVGTTQHARRGGLDTGGEAGHGARDAEAALVVLCSSCIFTVFGANMFGYYRSKEPTQLTLRYVLRPTME